MECCVCYNNPLTKEEIDNWDRHVDTIPLLCKTCNTLTCNLCIFDIEKSYRTNIGLKKGQCPVCKTIDYKYIWDEDILCLFEDFSNLLYGELPYKGPIYKWVENKNG